MIRYEWMKRNRLISKLMKFINKESSAYQYLQKYLDITNNMLKKWKWFYCKSCFNTIQHKLALKLHEKAKHINKQIIFFLDLKRVQTTNNFPLHCQPQERRSMNRKEEGRKYSRTCWTGCIFINIFYSNEREMNGKHTTIVTKRLWTSGCIDVHFYVRLSAYLRTELTRGMTILKNIVSVHRIEKQVKYLLSEDSFCWYPVGVFRVTIMLFLHSLRLWISW